MLPLSTIITLVYPSVVKALVSLLLQGLSTYHLITDTRQDSILATVMICAMNCKLDYQCFYRSLVIVECCGLSTDETCEDLKTPIPGATCPL